MTTDNELLEAAQKSLNEIVQAGHTSEANTRALQDALDRLEVQIVEAEPAPVIQMGARLSTQVEQVLIYTRTVPADVMAQITAPRDAALAFINKAMDEFTSLACDPLNGTYQLSHRNDGSLTINAEVAP